MVFEAPEVEISSNTGDPSDIRHITGVVSLPTGASTAARQDAQTNLLTSIDNKTPNLVSGRQPVDGSGVTQPISATALPLPTGAATAANQTTELNQIGATNEPAPANDTASSGLNGRLQRIAQRLTSLINLLPVSIGQKNAAGSLSVTIASDQTAFPVTTTTVELPTFSVVAQGVQIGNGKSLLSILNTGTSLVKIREIWLINDRTTAVTGVAGDFEFKRITGHTGGTALTAVQYDTIDTLPATITMLTGATVSGEAAQALRVGTWSTDEWGVGTLDQEGLDHALQQTEPFWKQTTNGKAIVLRQNQGAHLKFVTNSTAGFFNVRLIFTVE